MMDIKGVLLQWFINFLKKKSSITNTSGSAAKSKIISDQELSKELHKTVIKKFEKWKVHTSLDNMQLRSKFNKGIRFLLCVTDIFRKHTWVIPLKTKKV